MKNFIILLFLLGVQSCNSQVFQHTTEINQNLKTNDTMRYFNIKEFVENSKKYNASTPNILDPDYKHHLYYYTTKDGTYIQQNKLTKGGYQQVNRKENSPFEWVYVYYESGILKSKTQQFLGETIGQTVVYDENGKIIKEIESDDKWYKHSFADIREIVLKLRGLDIYDDRQALVQRNKSFQRIPQRIYTIQILEKGVRDYFIKDGFFIDDETGKEIKREDIKVLENPSDSKDNTSHQKTTINNNPALGKPYTKLSELPSNTYQIYDGIAYTKPEWEAFQKSLPWWKRIM